MGASAKNYNSYNTASAYSSTRNTRSTGTTRKKSDYDSNSTRGVEFELYIKRLLEAQGCKVSTTPTSNDYGADLFAVYKGKRIAIQCKCYTASVGVAAVQEVVSSLPFYGAEYGMVVTNSTFTQQARNLAEVNKVVLIDKNSISFLSQPGGFGELFGRRSPTVIKNYDSEEWDLSDLVVRYGLSKNQILKYIVSQGLPYIKVGREYRFDPAEVEDWERKTKRVETGRGQIFVLPAYKEKKAISSKRARKTILKIIFVTVILSIILLMGIPGFGDFVSETIHNIGEKASGILPFAKIIK